MTTATRFGSITITRGRFAKLMGFNKKSAVRIFGMHNNAIRVGFATDETTSDAVFYLYAALRSDDVVEFFPASYFPQAAYVDSAGNPKQSEYYQTEYTNLYRLRSLGITAGQIATLQRFARS